MDLQDYPDEIRQAASRLENARANNYQVEPLSKTMPELDQKKGYRIAAAIKLMREQANGDKIVGRKIGFSNHGIWDEYGIDRSNWSYVYERLVTDIPNGSRDTTQGTTEVDISHFSKLQPRIEPEIVVGVADDMSSTMSDLEILQRVEWIAHGCEIVISPFPAWKFTAADTTAAFALHGQLLCGPKISIHNLGEGDLEQLLHQLANFKISLKQNQKIADEGKGSNVLGSPIKALRHLLELLEDDEPNKKLYPGEIVTTGTLTRALPIDDGDTWTTELSGIDLPGLNVRFKVER